MDDAPLEVGTVSSEDINRLIYNYARNRTMNRLRVAVEAGIIDNRQAHALMDLWYRDHPYRTLIEEEEAARAQEGGKA